MDQVILTCVALGWPDDDFIANGCLTPPPVANITQFIGFEDRDPTGD